MHRLVPMTMLTVGSNREVRVNQSRSIRDAPKPEPTFLLRF